MSLPRVHMVGRLTDDPELRFTPQGKAVANMRVACSERGKDESGNWVDKSQCFLSVQVWESMAENVTETLHKGDGVVVVGTISQRSYETGQGEKRTVYEVRADSIGPDLRWVSADVKRVPRGQTSTGRSTAADPWATDAKGASDDKPPF